MHDTITQMRLAARLDAYLRDYTEKHIGEDHLAQAQWDLAWQVADVARMENLLTPELVDDVRTYRTGRLKSS